MGLCVECVLTRLVGEMSACQLSTTAFGSHHDKHLFGLTLSLSTAFNWQFPHSVSQLYWFFFTCISKNGTCEGDHFVFSTVHYTA